MAYWLLKSEPTVYSWDRFVADGRTRWDGVKNAQALNNLRAMREGDQAFFYHSNEGKQIVGVAEVVRPFYPDPKDPGGKLGMVDLKPIKPLVTPVSLAAMKQNPELKSMSLIRQSRLSVCPITEQEWAVVCGMAGS